MQDPRDIGVWNFLRGHWGTEFDGLRSQEWTMSADLRRSRQQTSVITQENALFTN